MQGKEEAPGGSLSLGTTDDMDDRDNIDGVGLEGWPARSGARETP